MKQSEYDVVVVGAGMAGLTAGIYLKRSSLSSVLLEKSAPGGKLNNIHLIENYPATPSISGPELADKVLNQADALGVKIEYTSVISLSKDGDLFKVATEDGVIICKAVVVATGVITKGAGVKGEKEHVGKGVSYCATCDGNFFRNKEMAVYGDKDHAVEDALYLSGLASKVYFLAPKPIEATEVHLAALKALPNVEIRQGVKLLSVEGEPKVESVLIQNESGQEEKLEVSCLFPLFGEKSSSEFLSPLNLAANKGFLIVGSDMSTSCPGVYACGDIVDKKLRQLINAAGEAAVAATSAISYLNSLKRKG